MTVRLPWATRLWTPAEIFTASRPTEASTDVAQTAAARFTNCRPMAPAVGRKPFSTTFAAAQIAPTGLSQKRALSRMRQGIFTERRPVEASLVLCHLRAAGSFTNYLLLRFRADRGATRCFTASVQCEREAIARMERPPQARSRWIRPEISMAQPFLAAPVLASTGKARFIS